jgi:hypothetical protein
MGQAQSLACRTVSTMSELLGSGVNSSASGARR